MILLYWANLSYFVMFWVLLYWTLQHAKVPFLKIGNFFFFLVEIWSLEQWVYLLVAFFVILHLLQKEEK